MKAARPLACFLVLAFAGCAHPGLVADAESAAPLPVLPSAAQVDTLSLPSPEWAQGAVRVDVHLPPGYDRAAARGYPVLYLNDGQDAEAVALQPTLARLYAQDQIRPVIVVAIHMLSDRMGTYGLSDRAAGHSLPATTRHGRVGALAHEYSEWVSRTVVPYIDATYRTRTSPDARAVLGWSLGGLNAFNLAWQYPGQFGRVGAFSPSFWLASDLTDHHTVQATRLAHAMVDRSEPRTGLKLFFAVGSAEETDDRDGDGIIDVLDDTRDLMLGDGTADAPRTRGLSQLGYSTNPDHATRPTRADAALFVMEGGEHNQASWARMLPEFLRWAYGRHAPALEATGEVVSFQEFESRHVAARAIDVWLPPGYDAAAATRYPVVYMHDGQNLFDPKLSYIGVDWGVDEAMSRLIAQGEVRPAIVVGIANTPRRGAEYMPRKAAEAHAAASSTPPPFPLDDIQSDAYLRFLVEELKPFVDATFQTKPERDSTFVMGSSMGGLISLYAIAEYPDVFGGAAGVSTHWPAGDGAMIDYLAGRLPDPRTHKLYFDAGTATLDAEYAPYQRRMDTVMRQSGYEDGRNWISREFPGAEHTERAWRERVDVPLKFFLHR